MLLIQDGSVFVSWAMLADMFMTQDVELDTPFKWISFILLSGKNISLNCWGILHLKDVLYNLIDC